VSWINTLFPFKATSPFLPFKQDEWVGRKIYQYYIFFPRRPPKILPPSGRRKLLQRKQWSGGADAESFSLAIYYKYWLVDTSA